MFSRAQPKTWSSLRTSANPIRTNRPRRILARSTTRPNTIPHLGSTIVRIRVTAVAAISIVETAAMTVEEIEAEIAVGVDAGAVEVVVVVGAAEAGVLEGRVAETCLRRNMLR